MADTSFTVTYNSSGASEMKLSEDYTPQTIFNQIWEAPYDWFRLNNEAKIGTVLPAWVDEVDDMGDVINIVIVTSEMIVEAAIRTWFEYVMPQGRRSLADFLQDLDANDVDAILQVACFGELRYS
jgi:hypothetical protein